MAGRRSLCSTPLSIEVFIGLVQLGSRPQEFLHPGFWFLISAPWFLVSGFWFLVSGFWFPHPGFREPGFPQLMMKYELQYEYPGI